VEEEEAMRLFDNRDLTVEVFLIFFVRGRCIYGSGGGFVYLYTNVLVLFDNRDLTVQVFLFFLFVGGAFTVVEEDVRNEVCAV